MPDRDNRTHKQLHSMDKFFLINELKNTKYDRFLIVDMDVLMRRDSPNIFDIVNSKLAAFNEGSSLYTTRGCDKEGVDVRQFALESMVNYPTPKGIGLPASTSVALDYSQVLRQVHRLFP